MDFGLCVCVCVCCVTFVELRRPKDLELGVEKGREERDLLECRMQKLRGEVLRIKEVVAIAF